MNVGRNLKFMDMYNAMNNKIRMHNEKDPLLSLKESACIFRSAIIGGKYIPLRDL